MILRKNLSLLLLYGLVTILPFSCRQKISFPDFNSKEWITDAFSCRGIRPDLVPGLQKIRLNLRGLTTGQIMEVLGKPDAEALLANNQRIYYYYIQPGSQCQNKQKLSEANKFMVRFNALEQASEVSFEQPVPEVK